MITVTHGWESADLAAAAGVAGVARRTV